MLDRPDDFKGWRQNARKLLLHGIHPSKVSWRLTTDAPTLFSDTQFPRQNDNMVKFQTSVPKLFLNLASNIICHRDPERFARLYVILWRLQTERRLLVRPNDDDVHWLYDRNKSISRDIHKMHAFVRFRKIDQNMDGREAFAAWFEPNHFIVRRTAVFFRNRFYGMDWAIITPDDRAIWRDETLSFGPGGKREDVPERDIIEEQWRLYYRSIFNPARVKVQAMRSEMPKKYWKNLPEADQILPLLQGAPERVEHMRRDAVTEANRRLEKWRIKKAAAPVDARGIEN